MSDICAAIGMSRKWDAREAGREVVRNTIKQLDTPPNFFLLFSTIHYKDHGGFQEFLNGVWDVLPKNTPLIGGTIAGFINNYGCYTRGATALAVSYPNMNISIGYGKNTKRNPVKAAKSCIKMINENSFNSHYEDRFLLDFISGPGVIRMPGGKMKKVVKSGITSKFIKQLLGISQVLFQKGLGREDEIFEVMVEKLPNDYMILGTSIDDYKGLDNYQFYNSEIFTNSTVNLAISTDLDFDVYSNHGMEKTEINFEITKISKDKHIVYEINNKPAVPELLRLMNWREDFLNEDTMAHTIMYYPISFKRNNREVPAVMPFILKDSIMIPCVIDKGRSSILTTSGKNLLGAIKNNLNYFNDIEPSFGLSSACMTILQSLGYKVSEVQLELKKYFGDKPFIMFVCAGEGSYSPEKGINYANMSFNTAIFGKKNS